MRLNDRFLSLGIVSIDTRSHMPDSAAYCRRAGDECSLKLSGFLVLFPVLHVSVVYAIVWSGVVLCGL